MRALEVARSRRCFFLTTEGEEASRGGGGPGEKGGSQARAAAVPHPSRVRPLFSLAPIFPPPPPSGTARQLGTIVSAKREAEASDGDLGAHYGVSILLGRRDEPLIATAARVRRGGKTFGPARILPFSLFPSFPFLGPWFFVRARARGADARAARLSPALSTLTVSQSIASLGGRAPAAGRGRQHRGMRPPDPAVPRPHGPPAGGGESRCRGAHADAQPARVVIPCMLQPLREKLSRISPNIRPWIRSGMSVREFRWILSGETGTGTGLNSAGAGLVGRLAQARPGIASELPTLPAKRQN